jgi:hypothetical protein
MGDPSSAGLNHQESILDAIVAIKAEIEKVKRVVETAKDENERTRSLGESFQRLSTLTALIESESNYFFELSNCKHLMMKDNIDYIKKLEQAIQELKS